MKLARLGISVAVAVAVVVMLWAFVGVERTVGDHELGTSWEVFVKRRPAALMLFHNPSRQGLEVLPFNALSLSDQAAFIEFCAIRFGVTDPLQCRAMVMEGMV